MAEAKRVLTRSFVMLTRRSSVAGLQTAEHCPCHLPAVSSTKERVKRAGMTLVTINLACYMVSVVQVMRKRSLSCGPCRDMMFLYRPIQLGLYENCMVGITDQRVEECFGVYCRSCRHVKMSAPLLSELPVSQNVSSPLTELATDAKDK